MSFMPQLLVAFGVALVVVVLLLLFRSRAARNRGSHHSVSRGPANLRFVCAGCEVQFNHTRRTLGAWEKGTRRFYCNACHTKWRGSHPTQPIQGDATGATGPHPHTRRAEPAAPGLGLTTAFRIIEKHHGKIRVHSVVDEGTTMTVTLPAARREAHLV